MLLDPAILAAVIPGCRGVKKVSETDFKAEATIGVGPVKGRYRAAITLSDLDRPNRVTLAGTADGALGLRRNTVGTQHIKRSECGAHVGRSCSA